MRFARRSKASPESWQRPAGSGIQHTPRSPRRETLVAGWLSVAALLDHQGDAPLAREVRQFVRELPPVLTDRERIATSIMHHIKMQKSGPTRQDDVNGERVAERTR